jgi:myo-inositol 2-dehydrogenase/D-chiro-inositol 1-dehydrogenase
MQPSTPSESSRRDFLKTSLAAGAIAGAAQLAFPTGVHAGGSDQIKLGLIGAGGRGSGAAVNALRADKNIKLVAVADAFSDRLEDQLAQIRRDCPDKVDVPPERRFVGFDAYQKVLASDVNMVILATPPQFRPLHARAAVEAGKHVFFEKPVAVDPTGIRSFMQTAREAEKKGLCFASGFCYRYDLAKRETIKRIHDGAIGDVVAMQANYITGPIWHRGGDVKNQDMEYQMRNWYYFTWLSGDFIVEQHVHNMDKAAWVMKGELPVAAYGMGGRVQRTDPKYGSVYDHFSIVYEYAGGQKLFSYCRQIPKCFGEVSDHVFGTKGSAQLMEHTIAAGKENWAYTGRNPNMYQQEQDEIIAALRAGKPINDGISAANSSMMAILGRMCAYTGQKIEWDAVMKSKLDLTPKKYDWGPLAVAPVAIPGVTKFV